MFLLKAIETVFNSSSIFYSLYLSLGFLASQFLNIHVYETRGASSLRTWSKSVRFIIYQPSIKLAKLLCIIMAISIFLLLQLLIPKISKFQGEKILTTGIFLSAILCVISQLIFSSVMRLTYEFSFCLILFAGIIVSEIFIQPHASQLIGNPNQYQELWDLLKTLIPICIGFPILVGGAGLIASFYKEEQEFLQVQLYRHIAMSLYFEIGAALFLFMPLIKKILSMRGN